MLDVCWNVLGGCFMWEEMGHMFGIAFPYGWKTIGVLSSDQIMGRGIAEQEKYKRLVLAGCIMRSSIQKHKKI